MSNWIQKNVFTCNETPVVVETSKYTQAFQCAEPNCQVILVWNAMGGDEEDLEFRVKGCTCGEENLYTLCCSAHKNTFQCPHCSSSSNDGDSNAQSR